MLKPIIEQQNFHGITFTQDSFVKGEYESCSFTNCVFSDIDL